MKRDRQILIVALVLLLAVTAVVVLIRLRQADSPAAGPAPESPTALVSLPVAEEDPAAAPAGLTLADVSVDDFRADTPFVELYNNVPGFSDAELTTNAFETYAELDELGRCGPAYANICLELMPTGERGNISRVKPTAWHSVSYDNVDGKSLYNRCHLIGWQLAGEDANWKNLITGTRYLNIAGMLPFEDEVASYVKQTGNHVLYRVTPVFRGDNLLADGVQMEALSVEDNGAGVCFNVFCYNAQPGIAIDYATGESQAEPGLGFDGGNTGEIVSYILNTGSRKFHLPDCSGVEQITEKNRSDFTGTRDELTAQGYQPCKICNP